MYLRKLEFRLPYLCPVGDYYIQIKDITPEEKFTLPPLIITIEYNGKKCKIIVDAKQLAKFQKERETQRKALLKKAR